MIDIVSAVKQALNKRQLKDHFQKAKGKVVGLLGTELKKGLSKNGFVHRGKSTV